MEKKVGELTNKVGVITDKVGVYTVSLYLFSLLLWTSRNNKSGVSYAAARIGVLRAWTPGECSFEASCI